MVLAPRDASIHNREKRSLPDETEAAAFFISGEARRARRFLQRRSTVFPLHVLFSILAGYSTRCILQSPRGSREILLLLSLKVENLFVL